VDDRTDDTDDTGSDADAAEDDSPGAVRRRRVRSGVEWVAVIAGAVVIALIVRTFLFTTFWIPSGSMEPTLMGEGRRDRVVVNRLAYKWGEPGRGDIIVFEVPEGEPTMQIDGQDVKDLIKRVIGLPGETVELRDGEVWIDGEKLDEPYLPEGTRTDPADPARATFIVPDDCVFVLGDNRTASRDARFWQTPCVPEDDIVGKAFIRIWPLSAFGGI
jgi:signal peptidase I